MVATPAWKRHGCYQLGSEQYFNMPLDKSIVGCNDDWNARDHFDPTSESKRMFAHYNYLRTVYGALQDGFNLVQRGNWTYLVEKPGSNHTTTEMGLWSISRSAITDVQTLNGTYNDQIWMLYTNENSTKTSKYNCKEDLWISSPYQSGTTVRNLFAPYETYTLEESLSSYYNDSKAPYFGCLSEVTMDPYGFKALVPEDQWVAPLPSLTKFTPGHDIRIQVEDGDNNATTVDIVLEFDTTMDCDGVTNSISLDMASSNKGSAPSISNVNCGAVENADASKLPGGSNSQWSWSATLTNFPDGVLRINVNNPASQGGNSTNVSLVN
jgi:alpha-1,3-glucan synthase